MVDLPSRPERPLDGSLRATARALQRRILVRPLPPSQELEIAVRWAPAGDVAGDWFDVIDVGAGRIGLAVGDVMGRGVAAVAAAGQLRAATRACARLDLPPEEVLTVLDGLVGEADDGAIATCAYAVFDPHTRDLLMAVAGHPPPVYRLPQGGTQVLRLDDAAALGLGDPHRQSRVPLAPGGVLALYTDGLLDAGAADLETAVLALAGTLAAHGEEDLEGLADRVLAAQVADDRDDAVLLLLRVPADVDARSTAVTVEVPRNRGRLGQVRTRVRELTRSWALLPEIEAAASQLAGELVANALLHGRGRVELRLRLTRDRLVVEVADDGWHMPRRRRAARDDEGGRGLQLVATLAHRWGARLTEDGKVVWAELDLAAG